MNDRIRTLLIHATNFPSWKRTVVDTVRLGLGLSLNQFPASCKNQQLLKRIFNDNYNALSYVMDWRDAFHRAQTLEIDECRTNHLGDYLPTLRRLGQYDLIVILHSAAGDCLSLLSATAGAFLKRRGKLAIFFGNEYALMPEKIDFAKRTAADWICTQLPLKTAQWLYSDCPQAQILPLPAALNPDVYRPSSALRPVSIGFRGSIYPYFIGDQERTRLLVDIPSRAKRQELAVDMAFNSMERHQWAHFLQTLQCIPGAEAGTYYLEKTDHTQRQVIAYLKRHPHASFDDVYDRFFKNYRSPVSGKAISSRHFEAMGTQTCQILLEGDYNGILEAGKHYIPVRKDLSNLDDVLRQIRDQDYTRQIARQSHELALSAHTYTHRVDAFLRAVG